MTIEQEQKRALLDWSRFDVAKGEEVHFKQGGADWIALNRIFDSKPSEIAGKITAKGQVWLTNSNGIVFKDGAQVNVHTILASTLTIREEQLYDGLMAGSGGERGVIRSSPHSRLYAGGGGSAFYNVGAVAKPVEGLDPNTLMDVLPVQWRGEDISQLDILALAIIRMAMMQETGFKDGNGNTINDSLQGYRLDSAQGGGQYLFTKFGNDNRENWLQNGYGWGHNGLEAVLDQVTAGIKLGDYMDLPKPGDANYAAFVNGLTANNILNFGSSNAPRDALPAELLSAIKAKLKADYIDQYSTIMAAQRQKWDNYITNVGITVQKGATLTAASDDSASPGKIMLFGPKVTNHGKLVAHDGQVLMAAGEQIRLATDPGWGNMPNAVRGGLAVTVGAAGTDDGYANLAGVSYNWQNSLYWDQRYIARADEINMLVTNTGEILADRGSVSLSGANVDQLGSILVTNGVRQRNGAIVLQATHGFNVSAYSLGANYAAGKVRLGEGSLTQITPDLSDLTGLAADTFTKGKILIAGKDIVLERNSSVVSRSGEVVIHASKSGAGAKGAATPGGEGEQSNDSKGEDGSFTMREGARIDVSGLKDVERSVSENSFEVEVRSNELSASPKQRDGLLQGKKVFVDAREGATIVDWTGALAGEQRTAQQMSTEGGTVQIRATNYAIVENGAVIDVSGGSTKWTAGEIKTTRLQDAQGRFHNIADADPNRQYVGMYDASRTVEGYMEGANAGSVQLLAPSSRLFGKLKGDVIVGEQQLLAAAGQVKAPKVPVGAIAAADVKTVKMPTPGEADLHRGGPEYAPWSSTHAFVMNDRNAFTGTLWSQSEGGNSPFDVSETMLLDPSLIGQDWAEYEGDQPRFIQFVTADFFSGMGDVSLVYGSGHQTRAILPGAKIGLLPGGSFSFQAEKGVTTIGDDVSVVAPSGSINMAGEFGRNILLSVAAPWVNDVDASADTVRGWFDGGSILLAGTLTAPITLDAGGGGWYRRLSAAEVTQGPGITSRVREGNFELIGGKGGDVSLSLSHSIGEILDYADINVAGLDGGGRLSLLASGALVIGPNGGLIPGDAPDDAEYLDDSLLQDMGVGSLDLQAGSFHFIDGANVQFRARNLLLNGRAIDVKTGSNLRDFSTLTLLPDQQRSGATLNLIGDTIKVDKNALLEVDALGTLTLNGSDITIDGTVRAHGGKIGLGGGGSASININTGALVDASGIAQTVKVPGGADGRGFWYNGRILDGGSIDINAGYLLLDAGAVLDVSGTTGLLAVLKPGRYASVKVNDSIGSNGGSISIDAKGGYILGTLRGNGGTDYNRAGSVSFTGGMNGKLLLPDTSRPDGVERLLNNLSGSIWWNDEDWDGVWDRPTSISEALQYNEWQAGQMGITVDDIEDIAITDAEQFKDFMRQALLPFMTGPGQDVNGGLMLDAAMTGVPQGEGGGGAFAQNFAAPAGYVIQDQTKFNNSMRFVMAALMSYNLDNLNQLRPGSNTTFGKPFLDSVKAFDTVSIGGKIQAAQALEISSKRVLNISGTIDATVDMKFSSRDIYLSGQQNSIVAPATAGTLTISGETVQFQNRFSVGGFRKVVVEAQGDMRSAGLAAQANIPAESIPGLYASGDVVLRAAQIYPTTDSILRFESGSSVRVEQTGRRDAPLSAGGELQIVAPLIQQAGTLRAPFGEIRLEAVGTTDGEGVYTPGRVELLAGSVTSTGADGNVILYGYTFDGQSWYAPLGVPGAPELTTPPEKRVSLTGDVIDVKSGAIIDVSGSGDVLGLEFVPGPLGQTNVLNGEGMYAIVPAYGDKVIAPIDPRYGTVGIGEAVWLGAFDGNAAGWYTLLPAEYALTPGGYLISLANEGVPGSLEARKMGDDSFAVLGHRGITGTSIADQVSSTFRLERGTDVRKRSEFFETYGNNFFSSERFLTGLKRSGGVYNDDPRLPIDGGFLTLAANQSLNLDGEIRAAGLASIKDARGGVVDITSDNIVIAAPGTDVSDLDGYLVLDPNKISNIAESLLIGGIRRQGAGGLEIVVGQTTRTSQTEVRDPAKSVGAENVVIRTNSANPLTGTELLFAANESVTVDGGAVVRAVGDGTDAANLIIAPSLPAYIVSNAANNRPPEDRGAFLRVSNLGDISVSRSQAQNDYGDVMVKAGATLEATDSIILDATRNTSVQEGATIRAGAITAASGLVSFGAAPADTGGFVASGSTLAALGNASRLTLKSYSTFDFYGDVALNLSGAVTFDGAAFAARTAGDVSIGGGTIELRNSDAGAIAAGGVGGGSLAFSADNVLVGAGDLDFGYGATTVDARQRLIFDGAGDNSFAGALTVRATEVTASSGASHEVKAAGAVKLLAQATPGQLQSLASAGALLDFIGSEVEISTAVRAGSGTIRATAESGDVLLGTGGLLDVSGSDVSFFEVNGFLPAGGVQLTSVAGDVRLAQGSLVDISGGSAGGDAGALVLSAGRGVATMGGTLRANVASGHAGGAFGLTVSSLSDFGGLNALLNGWGISRSRDFAILDGDVLLNGTTRVDALRIVTGNGDITVASDAVIGSDSAKGGSILLASGGDLTVQAGARLDVNAKGANQRGGSVDLQVATGGTINVGAASFDVSGSGTGEGGEVRLRAPQLGNDVGVSGWAANVTGGDTRLEAFRVYDLGDADGDAANGHLAEIDTALQNQVMGDAAAFMAANSAGIRARLGQTGKANFHIVPGIELRSDGNLDLVHHWNLKDARYDGQPGVLTLRAGGDLRINANLSDGFVSATATPDQVIPPNGWNSEQPITGLPEKDLTNDQSWSYNLVAGADFAQTNVLSVKAGSGGDIEVGGLVRTGTGDIRLAASGDLAYENVSLITYQFSSNAGDPGGNGTKITVPAGTVITDGTVMKPTTWTTNKIGADGQPVTVTYYPRLPAGTVLRKGTSVPAGTDLNGTVLAADTVLTADVTLATETLFPGQLVISGKTRTGSELEIRVPRTDAASVPGLVASDGGIIPGVGDSLSNVTRLAFSVPGLGEVEINNHLNGNNTARLILADGRVFNDADTFYMDETWEGVPVYRLIDQSYGAIYTIGVEAAEIADFADSNLRSSQSGGTWNRFINPLYAEKGGDISVNVGGGISGAGSILHNNYWLTALGNVPTSAVYSTSRDPDAPFSEGQQTSLSLLPDNFRHGLGTLGGGDIDIVTGGDVDNLQVVLPSTVRVSGGREAGEAKTLHVTGGGDLTMRVGGDLLGGVIQVSQGKGAITVAGSARQTEQVTTVRAIGSSSWPGEGFAAWQNGNTQYLTLVLDDAALSLQAGGDILLRGITSTTGGLVTPLWLGYTADTMVNVTSLGGDITYVGGDQYAGKILPSKTAFIATAGSINVGRAEQAVTGLIVDSWPDTRLDLLAMQDIQFYGSGGTYNNADLIIGWYDPEWVGRVTNPGGIGNHFSIIGDSGSYSNFQQAGPGYGIGGGNVHSGSASYSRIYAAKGELRGRGTQYVWQNPEAAIANGGNFYFGHETRLKAGTDFRMGPITFIHHDGADLSSIEVNGSIYMPNVRFYGPGRLWVQAADEIWMGNTAGAGIRAIEARSSFADAVPLNGGGITTLAGIDQTPEYQSFFDHYLDPENLADAPKWLRQYFVEGEREGLTVSTPVVLKDGKTEATIYAIELVNYMRSLRGQDLIETEAPDEVSGSRPITRGALAAVIDPAEYAEALTAFKALDPALQRPLAIRILNAELKTAGREAVGRSAETDGRQERFGDPTRGYDAIGRLFPGAQRKPGEELAAGEHRWTGDLGMRHSQIRAENGGDIDLVVPGGNIQLASLAVANTQPATAGIVTQRGGGVNAITYGDYIVNQSRTMTADDGDILIWSSYGNIDAGRGRKSSLSVPPVVFPVDGWGQTRVQLSGLPNGAGIATLDQVDGKQGGDVDLYAFNGIVNAGDAGIRASRDLFVGAIEIRGLDNITVGGETNIDLSTEEGAVGPLNLENFARAAEDEAMNRAFDMAAEVEKLRTVRQTILTGSVVSFGVEECVETETNRCPPSR
ncbi:filamentous hemagglutinin family protein [Sandaracinobacter sp. RS1-74]|nr:filamentous hemagglutinin family protein [Sandaracinobacteroides sayramensis]